MVPLAVAQVVQVALEAQVVQEALEAQVVQEALEAPVVHRDVKLSFNPGSSRILVS